MLATDRAFRKWTDLYAKDEDRYFKVREAPVSRAARERARGPAGVALPESVLALALPSLEALPVVARGADVARRAVAQDFAAAFSKLLELGVPFPADSKYI